MLDSDDLLWANSISPLLDIALESKADIVLADYKQMTNEDIEIYLRSHKNVKTIMATTQISSGEDFLYEQYCRNVWRYLYRRDFILQNSISFIPGIISQDVPFANECFLKAKKSIRTTRMLNIYRVNRSGAATHSFSPHKAKSFSIAIAKTWRLRQLEGISSDMRYKLEEDMYISFRMMLYRTLYCVHNRADRNKIMDILNENTLKIFFTHSIKQRLFTALVKWFPHLFINFYYKYAQIAFKK